MPIKNIKGQGTQDIFDGKNSKAAGQTIGQTAQAAAKRKLDALNAAVKLEDLKSPPGNRLHELTGDLAGFHAINVNDQYRVIFRWTDEGPADVQIVDYH